MDTLKGKQIMVWTFMGNARMYEALRDYGDRISQIGLFSFKVRATGEIYESGVAISDMLTYINKWPHIKWLLTVANDGANSIFRALRDNTDGAQDRFLSEIVRIMEKYPWCDGIDIDLERGDGYSTHAASTAMFQNIYNTVKAYDPAKHMNICLPGMTSVNGSVGGENWCVYGDLDAYCDTASIMSYGMAWAGSAPGPVSPRSWLEGIYDYATKVMNPDKIFLGMPAYGWNWQIYDTPENLGETYRGVSNTYYAARYWMTGAYNFTGDAPPQPFLPTEAVLSVARKHMCQLAVLKFQQLDGLNTALPIGVRKINAFRTLTTESLAVFIPFKVQEIQDKGGIYFGENAISHNLIMCNKANLLNQSAFLLGVPGAGKSFSAKELIAFLMLHPDYANDDILICDPEGEFGALVKALGREKATVAHLVAGGKDRLNAMYMVEGYGEQNPIVEKSQFVMSLIEQIDKRGVGPQHKSIIDRCTALVYPEAENAGRVATLCDLRQKLLEQPEDKAREIALSLELYTTGSLDIFGRESTVDLNKPYVVFDIHGLGEQLKPAGSLVITDTILNRVTLNWKRGKRTHVFIDEFHVMFENEQSGIFFNSAWRQFRKRGAYPTAITQNVEYLLDSVQASTMLSNSEFIVMLNQAASDRAKLAKLLNISNEQMSYVTNADAGCGLIRYGSALVPFINRFPRDTKLYALMTTKPGEGVFGGEEVPA